MEAFKHVFLAKLGLTKPPSREEIVNYTSNAPNDMEVIYNRKETEHSGVRPRERRATTKQVVSFTGKASRRHQTPPNHSNNLEYIDISFDNFTLSNWSNAKVLSAKLHLFFSQLDDENPAASIRRERGSVDVFHTIDDHGSKELLDSRTVPLGVPIWRTFDVTDAVQL
ncbi:uncharacterized protein [Amphiura filiformis]|uniref:uncharacterized protein n=1 Tax=Amphiura filiformis TaxID=82378 RepID=UPI003B20E95C